LAHTLPMALLVAILLAGGRPAGDLEVVAFRAAGVGPLRLLRPVLMAGVVVALATAALTLVINPASNAIFQHQLFKILQTRAASPPVNLAIRPPGSEPPPAPSGGAATQTRYRYTAFGIYDMNLAVQSPFKGARVDKPEKNFSMRELTTAVAEAQAQGQVAAPY